MSDLLQPSSLQFSQEDFEIIGDCSSHCSLSDSLELQNEELLREVENLKREMQALRRDVELQNSELYEKEIVIRNALCAHEAALLDANNKITDLERQLEEKNKELADLVKANENLVKENENLQYSYAFMLLTGRRGKLDAIEGAAYSHPQLHLLSSSSTNQLFTTVLNRSVTVPSEGQRCTIDQDRENFIREIATHIHAKDARINEVEAFIKDKDAYITDLAASVQRNAKDAQTSKVLATAAVGLAASMIIKVLGV